MFDEIEDIIPLLQSFILPFIEDGVEAVSNVYSLNPYFSPYSFGCMLWDDLTGRFFSAKAYLSENGIEIRCKNNVNIITISSIDLHYHRVDGKTNIPKGAKSVKHYIESRPKARQLILFLDNYVECPGNIVLAIDANHKGGLRKVFLGLLEANLLKGKGYEWEKTFPVYPINEESLGLPESFKCPAEEEAIPTVSLLQDAILQPSEKDPDNVVILNNYKKDKGKIESDDRK